MRKKSNRLAWRLLIIILLWAATLVLYSCSCGDNGTDGKDDDTNDDTDDDTNDDTDDDGAEGWRIYTIDSVGGITSIAIDSNDKVHISYGFSTLKYATNKSISWEIFTVVPSSSGFSVGYPSIAIDSNNNVHISYSYMHVNYDNDDSLKYTTNKSGTWQTYSIGSIGKATSGMGYNYIAIDSTGKIHVSYYYCNAWDNENEGCQDSDLKYATNKLGSWQNYTVDSQGNTGFFPYIAIDSSDKVHISYIGGQGGASKLNYATNATGSWQRFEIGDSKVEANSIALDSNGKVHISFYDKNRALSYATNTSGAWDIFTVDSVVKTGLSNSIAVNSGGYVHISYCDYNNRDLKYATNKSGAWETFTLDSGGDVGLYTSIAVDSEDYVHISYYDRDNGALKYATNRPPDK